MPREKMHKFEHKKARNISLQKLCQEKEMHKFEPKKQLTRPYKNYAKIKKKKEIPEIQTRKVINTILQQTMPRKNIHKF